jgi:biotin carboxylase
LFDNFKKKILMLGAGTWQEPWIHKAHEMGLKVYATDWSADAPGAALADVFEAIDLKDKKGTRAFAQKHGIEAVFTSADIGVPTAAFVAARLGLSYHSEDLARKSTHKHAMRMQAMDSGLGIPAFSQVSTYQVARVAADNMGFPLVVKPVDSQSSRGVSVVQSASDLDNSFHHALQASHSGSVLLEAFMSGTEGSVEALVQEGEVYILGICDKQKSDLPYRYDLQLNYPGNYSHEQFAAIDTFVKKLVLGFQIKQGIIHIEIMVNGNDIRLIEFAVRGCGSKVITHLMPAMNGFDVMQWALASALGVNLPVVLNPKGCGMLKFIMLPQGRLAKLRGVENMRTSPGILDADIERKEGETIGVIADGRSRPGYLLAVGPDKETLQANVENALSKLEVEVA